MSGPLQIDGSSLTLEDVARIGAKATRVELTAEAKEGVAKGRALVDRLAEGDEAIYGVNTGFGTLAEVKIAKSDLQRLQRNLILSHAVGVGQPLPIAEARGLLLLRANVLAKGFSGIRPATLELLLGMLERDVVPVVPERGSVGASGDLAPLAHIALVLIGEGEAFFQGVRMAGREALAKAGLAPVVLGAKEGLALVNGTQAMCGVGVPTLLRIEALSRLADVCGAVSLEGYEGSVTPFQARIHTLRGQVGQQDSAAHLRDLLDGSEIGPSHADCGRVQDPYSFRCMPQVHGAARDGLRHARSVLALEINAATDNPLVFADDESIVSGGNFHGQPVSFALDITTMAAVQLMCISERRIEQLVNPALSRMKPFLAEDAGLNSGFMMAQVTAAALVAESRVLSHPACVDSIPTSANREDHVSMGMGAALKCRSVAEHLRTVLAIELLIGAQALETRQPLKAGRGAQTAYQAVRSVVPAMREDRELHKDITAVCQLIDSGTLANL